MAYLDVIPLATAKEYLKVDSGYTADDNQITRMIKSALKNIEDITNHVADQRNKTYVVKDRCVIVHDYPINSVVSPALSSAYEVELYPLSSKYILDSTDDTTIVLNVGYVDLDDYPDELIDAALEMIDVMYYANSKDGKKDISLLAKDAINRHKRFIL